MGMITTNDGTEIFYKDWGSGQAIVFSHGWPLSADDWDTQLCSSWRTATASSRTSGAGTGSTGAGGGPLLRLQSARSGIPTTQADTINADLLALLRS